MLPQAWNIGTVGWLGILPILLASLALIGTIAVVIFALRQSPGHKRNLDDRAASSGMEEQALTPREILQIRYVCGEISRDQYYEMLTDLN